MAGQSRMNGYMYMCFFAKRRRFLIRLIQRMSIGRRNFLSLYAENFKKCVTHFSKFQLMKYILTCKYIATCVSILV